MGRSDPTAYGTPAFDREYRGQVAYAYRILVVRRADGYTGAEFDDAVGSVLSGFRLGMFDAELENKPAERTTRTLAVGLAVFALIAGLVSILVVNQAVTRHVNGADADHPALSALGFTRPQRLWGLVAMVAPATIGATLVTTVASNAGSALMPVGLARRIEPEPGLRFDTLRDGARRGRADRDDAAHGDRRGDVRDPPAWSIRPDVQATPRASQPRCPPWDSGP